MRTLNAWPVGHGPIGHAVVLPCSREDAIPACPPRSRTLLPRSAAVHASASGGFLLASTAARGRPTSGDCAVSPDLQECR